MLMSLFTYKVEINEGGGHITVTRLAYKAERKFFIAGAKESYGLKKLMDSITDDQAEAYWPKERKVKEKKNAS